MSRSRSTDLLLLSIALVKCFAQKPNHSSHRIKREISKSSSLLSTGSKSTDVLRLESSDDNAASSIASSSSPDIAPTRTIENQMIKPKLNQSAVPSSRVSRLFRYGQLGVGLALGTTAEALRRLAGSSSSSQDSPNDTSSPLLNEANINRIVGTLSRMRGAALKLGQMLSIQDVEGMPPQIQNALLRLQNAADYMPKWQLERVMRTELGSNWREKFELFDDTPIAAASIGQVHKARLPSGAEVAVKVQYPNVGASIVSDLENLSVLLSLGGFLPKGLFLENTIKVAKEELGKEIDYQYEAESCERMGEKLRGYPIYGVPKVYRDLSTKAILTTEFVPGVPLGTLVNESQAIRDFIGESILKLCLLELFHLRFMQTDPNWSNFLYCRSSGRINLIDFGACREFSQSFTKLYGELLICAARQDVEGSLRLSRELGFLSGHETETMNNAHLISLFTLAKPFGHAGYYDFGRQTISNEVRDQIPTMLKHRLKPPPNESYSLHRKLSGAFLLCRYTIRTHFPVLS